MRPESLHLLVTTIGVIGLGVSSIGAERAENVPRYVVHRTASRIVIDGKLDEPSWEAAKSVG